MTLRAVFYEEDDAQAVAARLSAVGFGATVEQERLMGEDDDEDHPWAVVTHAPAVVMEALVDEYDGWLDRGTCSVPERPDGPDVVPPEPLDLPDAPRRVKGHFRRD